MVLNDESKFILNYILKYCKQYVLEDNWASIYIILLTDYRQGFITVKSPSAIVAALENIWTAVGIDFVYIDNKAMYSVRRDDDHAFLSWTESGGICFSNSLLYSRLRFKTEKEAENFMGWYMPNELYYCELERYIEGYKLPFKDKAFIIM